VDDQLRRRRSEKWSRYPPDVLPAFVAEMDFELAPCVRAALHDAIDLGDLGYLGDVGGLLDALAGFTARRLGWALDTSQVALVADVMIGFKELLLKITSPGDGVIISPPAYPPYFLDIPHMGRRVVEVPLLEDFALDWQGFDRAFAEGAKVLLLCSPHNPSGRVYTRAELEPVASLADAYGAYVIADEIHAPLTFGAEFVPWLSVSRRGAALTSASKAFNLPALKLGFVVGPLASLVPVHLRDHAGHLGAIAAEAAFRDGDAWLDETLAIIAANHARLPALLPEGVRRAWPAQARYLAWLDCRGLGDDPAAVFLERGRVALQPGGNFGAPGFARLNVGTTTALVEEAVRRMAAALTP
jgi:cystathionine beta-lyase